MRKERLAFVLLALVCSRLGAQQAAPSPQPGPVIEKSPRVVPNDPGQSSNSAPLQACPAKFEYTLENHIYRVGGGITPPKVTEYAIAGPTKEARKAYKHNLFKDPNEVISWISIVVDAEGHPTDLCLQKPAGFGLDERAAAAVRLYRFQPATKNGTPVAVRMTIEVRFEMH